MRRPRPREGDLPSRGRWRIGGTGSHLVAPRATRRRSRPPPVPPLDHRPRSVSELIDAAIALVRRNIARYAIVAAVCLVPAQVLQLVIVRVTGVDLSNASTPDFGALGAILVVSLVFFALLEASLAAAVAQSWEGRDEVDVALALRTGLRRWIPTLLAIVLKYVLLVAFAMVGFVVGMIIMIGVLVARGETPSPTDPLMFALGGVVMLVGALAALPAIGRLAAVPLTAILERNHPVAALRRSNQLTRGLWKHAVGTSAMAFLIAIVPYLGASLLASLLRSQIVEQVVGAVVSVLLLPVYVASLVALYYDLRIRKEGFDLELMASRLATAVPDAGPDVPATSGARPVA